MTFRLRDYGYGFPPRKTMLKEMKDTVVHCKSRKDYDELMQIYEDNGWRWMGSEPTKPTEFDGWESYGIETCISIRDHFGHASFQWYKQQGETIISLQEFKRLQGLTKKQGITRKFKVGDSVIFDGEKTVIMGFAKTKDFAKTNDFAQTVLIEKQHGGHTGSDYKLREGSFSKKGNWWARPSELQHIKNREFKVGDKIRFTSAFGDGSSWWDKGDEAIIQSLQPPVIGVVSVRDRKFYSLNEGIIPHIEIIGLDGSIITPKPSAKVDPPKREFKVGDRIRFKCSFKKNTWDNGWKKGEEAIINGVFKINPKLFVKYNGTCAWVTDDRLQHIEIIEPALSEKSLRAAEKAFTTSHTVAGEDYTYPDPPKLKIKTAWDLGHGSPSINVYKPTPQPMKCPFQVGQELTVTEEANLDGHRFNKGDRCVVKSIESDHIFVGWITYKKWQNWYITSKNYKFLKPVSISSPSPIMSVATHIKRALLSANERTLRDAGINDDCGDLTPDGTDALELILRKNFEDELVKAAKETIDERKKKK